MTTVNVELKNEISHRLHEGQRHISLSQYMLELKEIGYRLDRSMDSKYAARIISGPRAGTRYPALDLRPVQIDNGVSWCSIDRRKDSNLKHLLEMRETTFIVLRGRIADF